MKTECKVFRDDSWFIWKFPKRNTAIIFNADTKKYEFRSLCKEEPKPQNNLKVVNLKNYKLALIVLACALGVSLGYNAFYALLGS